LLYFVQFNLGVYRFAAYRDKRKLSVFVRFRCAASQQLWILRNNPSYSVIRKIHGNKMLYVHNRENKKYSEGHSRAYWLFGCVNSNHETKVTINSYLNSKNMGSRRKQRLILNKNSKREIMFYSSCILWDFES
jgi:hypothetical protein